MLENGINILSTYSREVLPLGCIMATFAAGLLLLICLLFLILEIQLQYEFSKAFREYKYIIILSLCSILLIFTTIISGIFISKKIHTITCYKVTISDEVSFNEVLEKYDIIDQEDLIYTITEKEK